MKYQIALLSLILSLGGCGKKAHQYKSSQEEKPLTADSTAVRVPVEVGNSNAAAIEIKSAALSPQDRIVLTGGYDLEAGATLDGNMIFNRFYRPSEKTGGNGLRLSIVKAVCRYHGWSVSYSYTNGQHVFTVVFC